ncbi:protein mahjong isoform X1 [Odontomachus brunneus]|uniref:protein mahjong isoform X1 n=1 Tax=Odontomachus brunneus TaxID=486640 RepID=UPI0013F1AD18|nr:protein mahjong isoform X1 [Odontomachus brunneus]XP_032678324.1 protein mahjong isoform X1 [Odontomachus brunneus]XP_032678325.1 protein mahjong isoform X1 [Odontomachus brunneus]
MASAESLAEVTDVVQILRQWEEEHSSPNYDPIPVLQRLAEIIELETENYLKMDPDPFDERHPSRTDPECNFGHILKVLFRKDNFMTKLINDYLRDNYYGRAGVSGRDVKKLNIAACRLMLDILPGLETSAVFQPDMDGLINKLFSWSEKAVEPLRSYSTGLLAAAMEVQDIATGFREQNAKMVPLMLQRLHMLQETAHEDRQVATNTRPFAHFGQDRNNVSNDSDNRGVPGKRKVRDKRYENGITKNTTRDSLFSDEDDSTRNFDDIPVSKKKRSNSDCEQTTVKGNSDTSYPEIMSPPLCIPKTPNNSQVTPSRPSGMQLLSRNANSPCVRNLQKSSGMLLNSSAHSSLLESNSNSSWAEMESYVIGNVQMHPPTLATRQILILRYLTPMGEYQEFLGHVFEQNALELILNYINVRETKDSRLAFEALKYLASLLCHKKFSIEFLNVGGLQRLLDVPRPSVAATGVSICLYYLAYCEDAMERVCLLPKHIISDLVTYALWLLERSHDSGRCHATMFFGFSFPFKVILEEFDAQDGLRKLFNVISTLSILNIEEEPAINDDEECASRQIVRHVAVALKRYMEAHLHLKAEQLQRAENVRTDRDTWQPSLPPYKACKLSSEEVQAKVEILQELMSVRAVWPPVEELHRLGGITLLLQIIAFAREWNYSGRVHMQHTSSAETVRSCLDVIAICSVVPKVMLLLCERVDMPDMSMTMAINLLLAAAECEIVADADVQRAALRAVINCVCAPMNRIGGNVARYSITGSAKKKTNIHNSEELIQKIWESVRSNNGIMVLLQLMMVKTPITDADSIRALACRALAGLARSEKVKQIISKLPMFTDGQIQSLMKDPILQEKRQEHVTFQKYALELIERVSGKAKPTGAEYEMSLVSLHRANVVAQTRIQYNEQQLNQLIHQHLMSKGLTETANTLHIEANLDSSAIMKSVAYQPFTYRNPVNVTPRNSFSPGAHLYNTSRCTPRETTCRNNTTPTSSSRFISHSTSCSSSPTVNNNVRLKFTDCLNQNVISTIVNQPIKLQISQKKSTSSDKAPLVTSTSCQPAISTMQLQTTSCRSLQKQISRDPGGGGGPGVVTSNVSVTLDSIITEYLTNQHALCKNPMVTCAQFNLFEPHKCPDPCIKNSLPTNVTVRLARRSLGMDSRKLDRKYIYSRFCPVKTFRPTDVGGIFTCCAFSPCTQYLFLGTHSGDIKMFNTHTGMEEATYQCHESYVYHIECNQRGNLLLTSTAWRSPMSALWDMGTGFFEMKLPLETEDYVEFGKLQDRVIGTQGESATIYDIVTGKLLTTLTPSISNQYTKNRATFSMNDELVLSDGILWDVNSSKEIHKFDKLNQALNGVFHPNGMEVVSNTEVWDLRTFHLLKTVPTLDEMEIIFSPVNNIIYAMSLDQETDEAHFATSFKTLDALDYSNIATYDVKRGIYGLACNKYDTQIAIVENAGEFSSIQESCVRLYDVGRRRDDEDEADEDDEEEDLDASDDDGSNSGSDDNNADADGDNADAGAEDNGDDNEQNDRENNDDDDDDDEDGGDGDDSGDDSADYDPNVDINDLSDDFSLSDMDDLEILFS